MHRGQKGKLFVLNSLLSLTNTHADALTSLTQLQNSLRPEVLLTEAHLGKMKVAQREKGGREGGYCRAHKAAWMPVFFPFFFCVLFSETHFPRLHCIYSKGRGSTSLSQAGNGRRERSIKAIEMSEEKHGKKIEEEATEAGKRSLTEGLSHSGTGV